MIKTPATDVYNFESLIKKNRVYIDKTDFVYKMVAIEDSSFFLARPRRFGKSLMVSTLKHLFRGKRHLFKDLKIDSLPYDWKTYPVIHLNMAELECSSVESLSVGLNIQLNNIAKELGLVLKNDQYAPYQFAEILSKSAESSEHGKVVLLIDEYDKPLVTNIGEPHLEEIRKILANFYLQIKNNNDKLRFTFIIIVSNRLFDN